MRSRRSPGSAHQALWTMGESALVQPFIAAFIRGFDDEWELTRTEVQRWADHLMQEAASRDGP